MLERELVLTEKRNGYNEATRGREVSREINYPSFVHETNGARMNSSFPLNDCTANTVEQMK